MAEDGVLSHEKSYEGWKWTADANVLNKAFSGFKNVNLVYFTHQQFAVGSGLRLQDIGLQDIGLVIEGIRPNSGAHFRMQFHEISVFHFHTLIIRFFESTNRLHRVNGFKCRQQFTHIIIRLHMQTTLLIHYTVLHYTRHTQNSFFKGCAFSPGLSSLPAMPVNFLLQHNTGPNLMHQY